MNVIIASFDLWKTVQLIIRGILQSDNEGVLFINHTDLFQINTSLAASH